MAPWYADIKLWIGLVLGILLSVPANIVSTALYSPTSQYFKGLRAKSLTKRKEAQLAEYAQLLEFQEGSRDRVHYFIYLAAVSCTFTVVAVSSLLTLLITLPPDMTAVTYAELLARLLLGGMGLFFVYNATAALRELRDVGTKLNDFENYKQQVKEKWGLPDEISAASPP